MVYAGVSKKDNHIENQLFEMSGEQNSAADYIEFNRAKKPMMSSYAAGVPNLGLHVKQKVKKYKYEPPYAYGGNLSTNISHEKINKKPSPGTMQNQYYTFMDQISRNPSSKSSQRPPYNNRSPVKALPNERIVLDPNLNIKPIELFIDQTHTHHSGKGKSTLVSNNSMVSPNNFSSSPKASVTGNKMNYSRSNANHELRGSVSQNRIKNDELMDPQFLENQKKFFMVDDKDQPSNLKVPQMGSSRNNLNPQGASTYDDMHNKYRTVGRDERNRSMNMDSLKETRKNTAMAILNGTPDRRAQNYSAANPYLGGSNKRLAANNSSFNHPINKPELLWNRESNSYKYEKPEMDMYRKLNSQQSSHKIRDPYAYNVISGSFEMKNML